MSGIRPGQAKGPFVGAGSGSSVGSRYWIDPVLSIFDNNSALPVGPTIGDRYIAKVTANGWVANYVYQWSGSIWVPTVPLDGMACIVRADNIIYDFTTSGPIPASMIILYGTGAAPDPTGYPDGTLYIQYVA
jgi:hypothetical protein